MKKKVEFRTLQVLKRQIIANKYGAILEDKKTDRSSSANKENAWQNIEREFNASSTTTTYRSRTSLKKCYENRKKELRKTVAEEYKQTMLTGGGPLPKIKKDETDDLLMSIINKKTLVGLENPFDDDVEVAVIQANKDINSDIVFEYVMEVDDETQNLSVSTYFVLKLFYVSHKSMATSLLFSFNAYN